MRKSPGSKRAVNQYSVGGPFSCHVLRNSTLFICIQIVLDNDANIYTLLDALGVSRLIAHFLHIASP